MQVVVAPVGTGSDGSPLVGNFGGLCSGRLTLPVGSAFGPTFGSLSPRMPSSAFLVFTSRVMSRLVKSPFTALAAPSGNGYVSSSSSDFGRFSPASASLVSSG